jgi:hypothetical protein
VKVKALNWGDNAPSLSSESFDYIIAADCLWVDYLVEPFVKTILSLCDKHTVVYISHEHRAKRTEDHFMELVSEHFEVSEVSE